MDKFIKLPSGVVVNSYKIEYFGRVNAVREPRKRNPSCYTFSIQFVQREEPITLSYSTREEAMRDYETLTKICD